MLKLNLLLSLSLSSVLSPVLLKHNSGIFTISLNKHLRLLNFVIIIKCSQIIVHEFCVLLHTVEPREREREIPLLPASFCNYLEIFAQLISSSSRSERKQKCFECLFICFFIRFIKINIHKCLKFSFEELFPMYAHKKSLHRVETTRKRLQTIPKSENVSSALAC